MDEMFIGIYSLECMDEMKSSYVDKIVEMCSIELDEMWSSVDGKYIQYVE
jgi:hypothetical protein